MRYTVILELQEEGGYTEVLRDDLAVRSNAEIAKVELADVC